MEHSPPVPNKPPSRSVPAPVGDPPVEVSSVSSPLDVMGLLAEVFADRSKVWIAPGGWGWNYSAVLTPHQVFLLPGEAILAVAKPTSQAAGLVFTDRRLCWIDEDGRPHRPEYPDLQREAIRTAGRWVVCPPTLRLRRRTESHYRLATDSEQQAQRLADALRILAGQMIPLATPHTTAWVPKPAPALRRGSGVGQGQGVARAPGGLGLLPPPPSPESLAAMYHAGDPALADALMGLDRSDVAHWLWRLWDDNTPYSRSQLVRVLSAETWRGYYWKAAKAIYKSAEDRRDIAMWGWLAQRLDTDRCYSRYATRIYMRRRLWRTLRTIARLSPANYAVFAAEALQHYDDATLEATVTTRWSQAPEKPLAKTVGGDPHRAGYVTRDRALRYWLLTQILHRNTPGLFDNVFAAVFSTANGRWPLLAPDPAASAVDGRAFAELWQRDAGPLLKLAGEAKSHRLRAWALAWLSREHPSAMGSLAPHKWAELVGSRDAMVAAFTWGLVTQWPGLTPDVIRQALIAATTGPHEELARQALAWLENAARRDWDPLGTLGAGVWLRLATSRHDEVSMLAKRMISANWGGWQTLPQLGEALALDTSVVGVLSADIREYWAGLILSWLTRHPKGLHVLVATLEALLAPSGLRVATRRRLIAVLTRIAGACDEAAPQAIELIGRLSTLGGRPLSEPAMVALARLANPFTDKAIPNTAETTERRLAIERAVALYNPGRTVKVGLEANSAWPLTRC